VAEQIPKL